MTAKVEIILGCMFSGKSTELIRRVNRYKSIGKNVLLINHKLDTRTDEGLKTHCGNRVNAIKVGELLPLMDSLNEVDIIGIDEAQFFPDLLEFVKRVEKLNKIIIIAGLDGDYKREPIGQILQIIPLCDEVVKLTAMDMVDKDGSPAIFSKRIVESKEQILIGATETYLAVSRKNYS
jgi:thymidine kinase